MKNSLMKIMPMISCKKASQLMSEGMNRRLSMSETIGLRMHLFMCGTCKQVLKQFQTLRILLHSYRQYLLSKSLKSAVLSQQTKNKMKEKLITS